LREEKSAPYRRPEEGEINFGKEIQRKNEPAKERAKTQKKTPSQEMLDIE